MIKKSIYIILAAAILASCTPEVKNAYVITGTVDTVFSGKVYLQKRSDGPLITLDSSVLSQTGEFKFKGAIGYPEVYYLTIPMTKSSVPFFIEPAEMIVNIMTKDINKTKITGSKTQTEYEGYLDRLDAQSAKIREAYEMYNAAAQIGDVEKEQYFDSVITSLDEERSRFTKEFVMQHPASFTSPYIIYRNSYDYDMDELDRALSAFDTAVAHSAYMPFLKDYLATLKRVAVGQSYVPFSMPDSSGTPVALADKVGKGILLVDFWASWCSPCRQENPNLVALYNDFHDKGFDIFGVSFDSKRDRWLEAVKKDGLAWSHVSDLKGWDNAAGKLYGIRSIPANVLLDSNGVIIAKNLRGEELRAKLEAIWPEPVKRKK